MSAGSSGKYPVIQQSFQQPLNNNELSYLKSFICPKCQRFYTLQMRGNCFTGRIPLIISCDHTICEECVRFAFSRKCKEVICGECNSVTNIDDADYKKKLQHIFPVNYYVFGLMHYYKSHMVEMSNINFKPAGFQFSQKQKHYYDNKNAFHGFMPPFPIKPKQNTDLECSQNKCNRSAQVNCTDCVEVFCEVCSDMLHKSARGLMKHKISTINEFNSPELKDVCNIHKESIIEFHCKTCQQNLCCYCVLGAHKEHEYIQMTVMSEDDLPQFKLLVLNAEEMLKRLQTTEKKVYKQISATSMSTSVDSVDVAISRYFENFHAKLQILERNLRKEVAEYKNINYHALLDIRNEVSTNIATLTSLVHAAKQAINNKDGVKFNVKIIEERLQNSLSIPCYLSVGKQTKGNIEFTCGNLLNDLSDNFKIKSEAGCSYFLVTENDLPDDYDDEEDVNTFESTSSIHSTSDALSLGYPSGLGVLENSFEKSSNLLGLTPAKQQKSRDNIESWIKTVNEQKKMETEMPNFTRADRANVTVTHINSPDCFYVQLIRMKGSLNKLGKQIDIYVKNFATAVQTPEINSLYIVKYMSGSRIQWCRGRIINEKDGFYNVFFIDYGNTVYVKKQQLKAITPELSQPAPFALECKLFDLYPLRKNEWDPKALHLMALILSGNTLLMIVMDKVNNVYEVDIITIDGDTSVRDALKFIGYGIPYIKTPTELDAIKKDFKFIDNITLFKKTINHKKGNSMNVMITYVIDPCQVYIKLFEHHKTLEELHESMKKYYTDNKKGYIYTPKKDMAVAVLHSDGISNKWFRGIISDTTDGRGMVTIKLVDVGNTINVSWNFIRKLHENFRSFECQAVLVKLAHLEKCAGLEHWAPNSVEFFDKFIHNKTNLKMVISEETDPLEVVLFECFPAVHYCVNAMLVKDNLAKSTGELSEVLEWPQYSTSTQADEDQTDLYTLNMMKTIQTTSHSSCEKINDSGDESNEKVIRKPVDILSAHSPDLIYVKFIERKQKQHEFYLELQDYYSKHFPRKSKWEKNNICIVFNEKQYFRAIILDVLGDNRFKVCLKDIAKEIIVNGKCMCILEDQFKPFPEFAVRCHLAGLTPTGGTNKWPVMACEFLQECFSNKHNFYLAKQGILDKARKSMPVVIWYAEFKPGGALDRSETIFHSINKMLLSNGLALKIKVDRSKSTKPTCDTETIHTVASTSKKIEEKSLADCNTIISDIGLTDWNEIMEIEQAVESSTQSQSKIKTKTPLNEQKNWISPLPFKEECFLAKATFVNDKGEIFLHSIEFDTALRDMEAKMKDFFSKILPEPDVTWLPGELCSAKFFLNDSWYRGQILSVDNDSIKVIMVDYGNEEDCDRKDLSKTLMYLDLPRFANKIKLHNVFPVNDIWQTSDLDILHAQIVDNTISVVLKGAQVDGQATPAIVTCGQCNINQFMLKQSSCLSIKPTKNTDSIHPKGLDTHSPLLNQDDSDVVIEEEEPVIEEPPPKEENAFSDVVKYTHTALPSVLKGEKLQIVIINVIDFNKIIFEVDSAENFEKHKELFETVSTEIRKEADQLPLVSNPQVGMPCVAKFSDDGEWYRALIFDIKPGHVVIWFVDFGNFENLTIDVIRTIKPSWLEVPVEHYLAEIDGIELTDKSVLEEVLEEMASYYSTVKLAEIVSFSPLSVRLYNTDTKQLSYQNLIDRNLLKIKKNEDEK